MEFVSIINSERIPVLQQDRVDLATSGNNARRQQPGI
jgi:hypothetical protein